ncbi:Outer membrane receptor for ferrienterochelin and colicins [Chromobacterium violaceum]|uniref:Outer membrane receptor for ferrienterochelin and colicins n=1 Tax=Chromobacterium violaceum TaxID=536 RepID=A0A3S4HLQ2_CHRVL|nr:Outer membrane receptor for ferrienterochelin and colicins [Chromobacterium violaceum]
MAKYPGLQPGDGAVNLIDVPYANLGSTITTGYDVGLQYELSLGGYGKLRFRDDLNNIMSFRKSDTQDSAAVNQLDNVSQPKWRNVFSTTYSYDRYDLMLTARSYAGTRDVLDSSAQDASSRIPSYTMWDLAFTARPLKNLVVNAGVNNVFGRSVPFSVAANDFVGSTQDLYGRSYFVSARYTFK